MIYQNKLSLTKHYWTQTRFDPIVIQFQVNNQQNRSLAYSRDDTVNIPLASVNILYFQSNTHFLSYNMS